MGEFQAWHGPAQHIHCQAAINRERRTSGSRLRKLQKELSLLWHPVQLAEVELATCGRQAGQQQTPSGD